MDVDELSGISDMLLRILVGAGIVGLVLGLWALLQRGEFSKECPRCHGQMPRSAARCRPRGWRVHDVDRYIEALALSKAFELDNVLRFRRRAARTAPKDVIAEAIDARPAAARRHRGQARVRGRCPC